MHTISQGQKSRGYIAPRNEKRIKNFDSSYYMDLDKVGIGFHDNYVKEATRYAMDSIQNPILLGTISTPVQFLQEWLPGFVHILTAKRLIDDLVGMSVLGKWHDEEIVQSVIELTGTAVPYGDLTNVNLADWNPSFNKRTVVRFEEGLLVGRLEEARASEIRINSGAEKRNSVAISLEIIRNQIGFFGFNNGVNQTYGILNDPSIPPYFTAAVGAGGFTQWNTKTFKEIIADIRQMIINLRNQSQENIDPGRTPITLALATIVRDLLSVTGDLNGYSVENWLHDTYPNVRVVSAPELNFANGGQNVGYMYAESLDDTSTDDHAVFMQVVPSKFMFLGVEQKAKGYIEAYSNATAGVMCKRPFGVTRITGI